MRVLLQRVSRASVTIDSTPRAAIGRGLLVFVGIETADGTDDIEWLSHKIPRLRVFNDAEGRMNRSLLETGGDLLVVSQFTLHGGTRQGHRPSFTRAASPAVARPLYEAFVARLSTVLGRPVSTGEFGARMEVALVNEGPVTLWIDSRARE